MFEYILRLIVAMFGVVISKRTIVALASIALVVGCNQNIQQKSGSSGSDDDDDDSGGYSDDDDDEGQTLEDILKECGGDGIADADENEVIYEADLKSIDRKLLASARIKTSAHVEMTGTKYVQDSTVTVTGLDTIPVIGAFSGLIGLFTKGFEGPTTYDVVPPSEYSSLSDHDAYDGILCTVVPATKVVNERGGKRIVAEFDPPFPFQISPRAAAVRYKAEIDEGYVFKDMTIKVIESDNDKVPEGTELTGKVVIEKVSSSTSFEDADGGKISVSSDLAYKMTADFGDDEMIMALGLAPEITVYLDHAKKNMAATNLDTKNTLSGQVIFIFD